MEKSPEECLAQGNILPLPVLQSQTFDLLQPLAGSLWISLGMTFGTKRIVVALHLFRRRHRCQERPEGWLCIEVVRQLQGPQYQRHISSQSKIFPSSMGKLGFFI